MQNGLDVHLTCVYSGAKVCMHSVLIVLSEHPQNYLLIRQT